MPLATPFQKQAAYDRITRFIQLEEAETTAIETLDAGIMTKDLVGLVEGITPTAVTSLAFIREIRKRLAAKLA